MSNFHPNPAASEVLHVLSESFETSDAPTRTARTEWTGGPARWEQQRFGGSPGLGDPGSPGDRPRTAAGSHRPFGSNGQGSTAAIAPFGANTRVKPVFVTLA